MFENIILKNTELNIERKKVLEKIGCTEENALYQQILEDYEEAEAEFQKVLESIALASIGSYEGSSGVYVLISLGRKVSALSSAYFENGEYMIGMILDAMADEAVFELERELQKAIKKECLRNEIGVKQRLEAPKDFSMEMQKEIMKVTGASLYGISLTKANMFIPVKTCAYLLLLCEDKNIFKAGHDCSRCSSSCKGGKFCF